MVWVLFKTSRFSSHTKRFSRSTFSPSSIYFFVFLCFYISPLLFFTVSTTCWSYNRTSCPYQKRFFFLFFFPLLFFSLWIELFSRSYFFVPIKCSLLLYLVLYLWPSFLKCVMFFPFVKRLFLESLLSSVKRFSLHVCKALPLSVNLFP